MKTKMSIVAVIFAVIAFFPAGVHAQEEIEESVVQCTENPCAALSEESLDALAEGARESGLHVTWDEVNIFRHYGSFTRTGVCGWAESPHNEVLPTSVVIPKNSSIYVEGMGAAYWATAKQLAYYSPNRPFDNDRWNWTYGQANSQVIIPLEETVGECPQGRAPYVSYEWLWRDDRNMLLSWSFFVEETEDSIVFHILDVKVDRFETVQALPKYEPSPEFEEDPFRVNWDPNERVQIWNLYYELYDLGTYGNWGVYNTVYQGLTLSGEGWLQPIHLGKYSAYFSHECVEDPCEGLSTFSHYPSDRNTDLWYVDPYSVWQHEEFDTIWFNSYSGKTKIAYSDTILLQSWIDAGNVYSIEDYVHGYDPDNGLMQLAGLTELRIPPHFVPAKGSPIIVYYKEDETSPSGYSVLAMFDAENFEDEYGEIYFLDTWEFGYSQGFNPAHYPDYSRN